MWAVPPVLCMKKPGKRCFPGKQQPYSTKIILLVENLSSAGVQDRLGRSWSPSALNRTKLSGRFTK